MIRYLKLLIFCLVVDDDERIEDRAWSGIYALSIPAGTIASL